ncbi:MAG: amidohydrolase family protein, partial [Plesiomonas sp.]|nr:amidohydrolase family protein [Plesiomonas sp.]
LGITVGIGHSGATYDQAMAAIDQGADLCTHCFNAMRLFHQHEPAIMGAVLESDLYCEMICDGLHLVPGTVRMLTKLKGFEKCVAITDSIMAAGLPDGNYHLGVNEVVVVDGDAKLADTGVRAGSTLTQNRALKNLLKFTGKPLEQILPTLTENPAKVLKLDHRIGYIADDMDADLVFLDENNDVASVFVKGNRVR